MSGHSISGLRSLEMHEYDALDPQVREQLRTWDLNFDYIIWFQVCQLYDDTSTRLKMYRQTYNELEGRVT
jgi:hypothetical protein